MRSLKMALIALMLIVLFGSRARAHDRAVEGMLVGTAVGGMMGYMVGHGQDRDDYGRGQYRHGSRHNEVCREVDVVREGRWRSHETVRTICRDREDWREYRQHSPRRNPYHHGRHGGYDDRW